MAQRLRDAGLRVGGFLQEPVHDGEDIAGWDAVDLHTGARCAVARTSPDPDLCDWGFDDAALGRCREWTRRAPFDVVVVEAGTLEASGGGHRPALDDILEGPPRVLLLCIRPHALAVLGLQLPDPALGLELPAAPREVDQLAGDVRQLVQEVRASSPVSAPG